MLSQYFPILLFVALGLVIGVIPMALGWIGNLALGWHRPNPDKLSPYECGFEAFEDARMKFDVRYYLVAILFILFDLEIAFLFPWAVSLNEIGLFGFVSMGMKGALAWENRISLPSRRVTMGASEGLMQEGFITTTVDTVINWTR